LKVLEDLEERAEVDVVVNILNREKIYHFLQLYNTLKVGLWRITVAAFNLLLVNISDKPLRGVEAWISLEE